MPTRPGQLLRPSSEGPGGLGAAAVSGLRGRGAGGPDNRLGDFSDCCLCAFKASYNTPPSSFSFFLLLYLLLPLLLLLLLILQLLFLLLFLPALWRPSDPKLGSPGDAACFPFVKVSSLLSTRAPPGPFEWRVAGLRMRAGHRDVPSLMESELRRHSVSRCSYFDSYLYSTLW